MRSIVEANKLENAATHKAWVLSHSPAEIVEINNARRHLNRLKVFKRKLPILQDDRAPKKPPSPYLLFAAPQLSSRGGRVQDHLEEIVAKWNALSESERQVRESSFTQPPCIWKRKKKKGRFPFLVSGVVR